MGQTYKIILKDTISHMKERIESNNAKINELEEQIIALHEENKKKENVIIELTKILEE